MARLRTACCALLLAGAAVSAPAAGAAADGACVPGQGAERDVPRGALDEMTWRQLNAIYGLVGDERYAEAFEDLSRMLGRAGRDRYLGAILNQALAQVEWARGDYEASLGYFERAVELDALPDETHYALMYQIAQLYYLQDRLDEALASLDLWFCAAPPAQVTPAAYVLRASVQARLGNPAAAIESIDRAIALDNDPPEEWYLLKLAAHYEREAYPAAAATLETLVTRWPGRKAHWVQLAQVCDRLGRQEQALAVLALARRRGLLDEQADRLYLASLYSRSALPQKAAEAVEEGIRAGVVAGTSEHWLMAADAWYAAAERERALAAYGEAGRAAEDGDVDLRRAYVLVDLERWAEALAALDQALARGGLDERRTGEAYLLRGMARFGLDDLEQAAADWERAGRFESAREAARQWLNHLREERRRRTS